MTLIQHASQMAEIRKKYQCEFAAIFRVGLPKYWSNLTGFDTLRFDRDVVQSGPNRSMADVIRKRWGAKGLKLVNKLLAANSKRRRHV